MKDEHLIPPAVMDIANKLIGPGCNSNERSNYYTRIQAIRDYCERILARANKLYYEDYK